MQQATPPSILHVCMYTQVSKTMLEASPSNPTTTLYLVVIITHSIPCRFSFPIKDLPKVVQLVPPKCLW